MVAKEHLHGGPESLARARSCNEKKHINTSKTQPFNSDTWTNFQNKNLRDLLGNAVGAMRCAVVVVVVVGGLGRPCRVNLPRAWTFPRVPGDSHAAAFRCLEGTAAR